MISELLSKAISHPAITKIAILALTLTGFTAVITIHEFGHFIFCKIFGVNVPTFSIGMGPSLIKKKIGGTIFQISALPLGGYVEIENPDLENGEPLKPTSFPSKPYWQKFLIMIGGIAFNIVSALIVYSIIFATVGMPTNKIESLDVAEVQEDSNSYGKLQKGDKIIGLNNNLFATESTSLAEFQKQLIINKKNGFILNIDRESKKLTISLDPVETASNIGIIGAQLKPNISSIKGSPQPIIQSITDALKMVKKQIISIKETLAYMISNKSTQGIAGPIMIISETFKIAKDGLLNFLLFLCFISINIALLNLLPLGMLDGGQIATVTIEAIVGRSLPNLKMILFIVSAVCLGGLMLLLSLREIKTLLGY